MVQIDDVLVLQFVVSLHHRRGIDREALGKVADGGELLARLERAGSNVILDLVYHLAINRQAGVRIDM